MVLASVLPLLPGVIGAVRSGINPHTSLRIIHVRIGVTDYNSRGLTYLGSGGHRLMIAEFVAVLAAVILSLARRPMLRRGGLLILCAWAGLWAANACVAAVRSGWWMFWVIAAATIGFAACVVCDAFIRWSSPTGAGAREDARLG
jgi:hypothetical protein